MRAALDLGAFPSPIPPNLLSAASIGLAAGDFTAEPAWAAWHDQRLSMNVAMVPLAVLRAAAAAAARGEDDGR